MRMYFKSGSRWTPSGVGTQMMIASHSASRSKFVVAMTRSVLKALLMRSTPMCLMYDSPRFSAEVLLASTSKPMTGKPSSSNSSTSGRPTYPSPITPTTAVRARTASRKVSSVCVSMVVAVTLGHLKVVFVPRYKSRNSLADRDRRMEADRFLQLTDVRTRGDDVARLHRQEIEL